jgi:hypothetical protein
VSRNPNDFFEKLMTAIKAWSLLRPGKKFAGYTLDDFKAAVAPSIDRRQELAEIDVHRDKVIGARDDADVLSRKALRRLVHSVIADADEGEDGELYAQMGYMPRVARSVLQSAGRMKSAEKAAAQVPEKEKEVA